MRASGGAVVLYSRGSYSYVANVTARELVFGAREPQFTDSLTRAMKFRSAEAAQRYKREKKIPPCFRRLTVTEGGFLPVVEGKGARP